MQIHEITKKNRPLHEGFMDAVSGIGSVAGTGINQALGTNIGGAMSGAKVQPGSIAAQTGAKNLALSLAPKIAKEQAGLWNQAVQAMMQDQGVASPAQLDLAELKTALDNQINRMLKTSGIDDWKKFTSNIDPRTQGGQAAAFARQVTAALGNAVGNIVKNTMAGKPNANDVNLQLWQQIAPALIRMQNMATFQGQNKAGQYFGRSNIATNQQASQLLTKAGVRGGALTGLQSLMSSIGPIPTGTLNATQKNMLQAIGLQVR